MIGSRSESSLEELKQRLKATVITEKPQPLTAVEVQRKLKLELLLGQLKSGNNVQNRQLQRWLTADEWLGFESDWKAQQELREELKNKPADVTRYEAVLRQAIFYDNRAEHYSSKGKKAAAHSCRAKSQQHCERARELLQEITADDWSVTLWFDRSLDFSASSSIDAGSPLSLPRVVTSRSLDKQANHPLLQTKLDVKTAVVEAALGRLQR